MPALAEKLQRVLKENAEAFTRQPRKEYFISSSACMDFSKKFFLKTDW
jgi:hypothetical protein